MICHQRLFPVLRLQHVWRMGEKSLQQCSSVYFQAPSGKLVSNLIQVGWSSVLWNAIFLFILFSFFNKVHIDLSVCGFPGRGKNASLPSGRQWRDLPLESSEAAGEKLCTSLLWMQFMRCITRRLWICIQPLCFHHDLCYTAINANRFCSHKFITAINHFL